MSTDNDTQVQEVNTDGKTEETAVESTEEAKVETQEKTIAEALEVPQKEETRAETVSLAKFLSEKNGRKAIEKEFKEFKESILEGASRSEQASSLKDIQEAFPDVDPKFLNMLAGAMKTEAKAEMESHLKPIAEKERREKTEEAFGKHYKAAMANLPEFENVVNEDVIRQLSLNPANSGKTFTRLIEETYGKAIPGKRTIESVAPGGDKSPQEIDFARAKTDMAYFREIMANPESKRKYNSDLIKRIGI